MPSQPADSVCAEQGDFLSNLVDRRDTLRPSVPWGAGPLRGQLGPQTGALVPGRQDLTVDNTFPCCFALLFSLSAKLLDLISGLGIRNYGS